MKTKAAIKTTHRLASFIVIFILVSGSASCIAQLTARGLGMGGAYTALARGIHAPEWNPANLGLPDNPRFSMSFIAFGAAVNNNSFTLGDYNHYFGEVWSDSEDDYIGQDWSERDKEDILNRIPDNGFRTNIRSTARLLSFSTGQFAFTFGADIGSYFQLDRDFFRLILEGNEIDQLYTLDNTGGRAVGVGVLGASWGQPIKVDFAEYFSVGGTLNLFYGGAFVNADKSDISLNTKTEGFDIQGDYQATIALGGLGWGIDIGAVAQMKDKWTISLSLANLIGSIPWSKDVEQYFGYFQSDSALTIHDIAEEKALEDSSWSVEAGSFSKKIPLQLRLGGAYKEGDYIITADYVQGFQKGAWISTKPRFAFGTEWWGVHWLPLRMGIILGGRMGFGTSYGFGLRPGAFKFDFGIMNRGFFWPNSSKGVLFGFDLGLEMK